MTAVTKTASKPRWVRTLHKLETLDDDLGGIGESVGPRTGPNKRTHGEKEDFVLRRLLVAWKQIKELDLPVAVRASRDEPREPDFVLRWPSGATLGIEITEAGEENYQAWLTYVEGLSAEEKSRALSEFRPSTPEVAQKIVKAIKGKTAKFDQGWYGRPGTCDLVVYDNTTWEGALDKRQILAFVEAEKDVVGRFRRIHYICDDVVYTNLFTNERKTIPVGQCYEIDFHAWILAQAGFLDRREWEKVDAIHIAEELDALARSDRHRLASHIRILLVHLLKWRWQPSRRGTSWRNSILNARAAIEDVLSASPSLRPDVERGMAKEYRRARREAARQMHIEADRLPEICPYEPAQLVDDDFFPEDAPR